ncbi:MAG: DUF3014 domain-containing protein [Steroidobacteraceae bacterium]|nr:DUF3014 domain-containing protein [Steroidobacteraceae bacterium]
MYAEKREPPPPDADERLGRWILGGVVLVALAVGAWYWFKREAAEPATVAEPPVATAEPAVRNPVETPADDADGRSAVERIAALVGPERFAAMFIPESFVRNLVATVDNLPRAKIATRIIPAKPPAGEFVAVGGEGNLVLGAANYARYAPWITLVDALDADAAVDLYRRLYPELQTAYENLGNPDGYFNDRVIEVIDHLLETPEPPDTIALTRPNVLYEFADPALEAQSAGRKLLLRMGPGNAARVKMKLRDIRDLIAVAQY